MDWLNRLVGLLGTAWNAASGIVSSRIVGIALGVALGIVTAVLALFVLWGLARVVRAIFSAIPWDEVGDTLRRVPWRLLAAVGAAALFAWFAWSLGFWGQFVLLTLGYLAIAAGIITILARRWDCDAADIAADNNTWFFAVLGMAIATSVTAWFVWGPALLLPSDWPRAETLTKVKDVGNHILFGKTAKPVDPVNSLPWAGGTWFFWKAALLYWLILFILIPVSFYDELEEAMRAAGAVWRRHRERLAEERAAAATKAAEAKTREEHRQRGRRGPPPPVVPVAPEPEKITFGDLLKAEVIGEAGMELLAKLFSSIWRNYRRAA